MARRADDIANDPVLVLIEDDNEPTITFDEWLALIDGDEPTDSVLDAAGILRDIREHGES